MEANEVLAALNFRSRVAEEEGVELEAYFVETDQWNRVFRGEVDIVYGAKGSGKSAIYSLIKAKSNELRVRGIEVLPLENVRGKAVFSKITTDPLTSEAEFRSLWKTCFLLEIARFFRLNKVQNQSSKWLLDVLEDADLISIPKTVHGLVKRSKRMLGRLFKAEAIEPGLKIDPQTGAVEGISCKISMREEGLDEAGKNFVTLEELLSAADKALAGAGKYIWFLLDRLDAAFAPPVDLEANALKGLLRAYIDLFPLSQIDVKIFLRSDIWKRLTLETGFREASHITRHITLTWNLNSLLNLIIRRALYSAGLANFYAISPDVVIQSIREQVGLFYRIFSAVEPSSGMPSLNWIISRTADGSGQSAPREVIHLLSAARDEQLRMVEVGVPMPLSRELISAEALASALPQVSRERFDQTLCAEYSEFQSYMRRLEGTPTDHQLDDLAVCWGVKPNEAAQIAERLVEIGFFERLNRVGYRIPYIYRTALRIREE